MHKSRSLGKLANLCSRIYLAIASLVELHEFCSRDSNQPTEDLTEGEVLREAQVVVRHSI